MAEGTIQSYNPLAYYVNNIVDLDPEVVRAHREKDQQTKSDLLSRDKTQFDVFICVNKHGHAFVLCVPHGEDAIYQDMMSKDVFSVPHSLLCWRYELCFEEAAQRTYKIRKVFAMFSDTKERIDRSYYVASFKDISSMAFQFAALRAAPHRYNAIFGDCVEFSKEFCISLLSYCSNWKEIERVVTDRIKEASATGLSLERLSRKYQVSGWFGNFSLGGADVTSLLTQQRSGIVIGLFLCLLFVYPLIVAIPVAILVKHYL